MKNSMKNLQNADSTNTKTNPKQNSYRLTEPTEKHKELLEWLGMRHLIGEAAVKALNVHQN
jgi:hypothetical protein